MITLKEAEIIANAHLIHMEKSGSAELKITKIKEEPFGWVFFYQSKEYLEKGNLSSMLAGNAPFVVLCASGAIKTLGTARPSDFYIEQLRKEYE